MLVQYQPKKTRTRGLTLGNRSGFIIVIFELHLLVAILLLLPLCITSGRTVIIPRSFLGQRHPAREFRVKFRESTRVCNIRGNKVWILPLRSRVRFGLGV